MVPEPAFNVGRLNALYAKVEVRMFIAIIAISVIAVPMGVYFSVMDEVFKLKEELEDNEKRIRILERKVK